MPVPDSLEAPARTSWRWPRFEPRTVLALFVLCLAIGLWQGSAVRLSLLGDGSRQPWSRPFLWELTGALSAWLCLPIVRVAVLNAPGPRVGWARFLGLQAVAFLLYTTAHITVMVGSRFLLYPWLGWNIRQ